MSAVSVVRVAQPADLPAIEQVLRASYPILMANAYDTALLSRALPIITRANPTLLSNGTYYLVERRSASGVQAVGCGGWSCERPGTTTIEPERGHIRHFATCADWIGQGIARSLFQRCEADARIRGIRLFECYSSLNAESFYSTLGFKRIEEVAVALGPDLTFPSIRMTRTI